VNFDIIKTTLKVLYHFTPSKNVRQAQYINGEKSGRVPFFENKNSPSNEL